WLGGAPLLRELAFRVQLDHLVPEPVHRFAKRFEVVFRMVVAQRADPDRPQAVVHPRQRDLAVDFAGFKIAEERGEFVSGLDIRFARWLLSCPVNAAGGRLSAWRRESSARPRDAAPGMATPSPMAPDRVLPRCS